MLLPSPAVRAAWEPGVASRLEVAFSDVAPASTPSYGSRTRICSAEKGGAALGESSTRPASPAPASRGPSRARPPSSSARPKGPRSETPTPLVSGTHRAARSQPLALLVQPGSPPAGRPPRRRPPRLTPTRADLEARVHAGGRGPAGSARSVSLHDAAVVRPAPRPPPPPAPPPAVPPPFHITHRRTGANFAPGTNCDHCAAGQGKQVKVLLSFHSSLSVFTVMGGTNMRTEATRLLGRQGPPSILIATPGRLVDHIQNTRGFTEALTRELRVLVLDEADRMLDQGFPPQMEKILAVLPRNGRQTALFSATLQGSVQGIKNLSLRADHAFVSTVREDEALTNARCKQEVVVAPDSAYLHTVAQILQANRHCKTIVFFPTTRLVDFAEEAFRLLGIPVVKLTGRMAQASRTRTFFSFCDAPGSAGGGSGGVMVCTDVAARGLDIPDVELIVQAGIPSAVEEYIHRISRTARAGNTGRAVLVIREFESPFLSNLQRKNITLESVAAPVEQASAEAARAAIQQLVRSDRELAKSAHNAYRTFLGYYVGACKQCGLSKPEMIARAFDFAYSIGIGDPPPPSLPPSPPPSPPLPSPPPSRSPYPPTSPYPPPSPMPLPPLLPPSPLPSAPPLPPSPPHFHLPPPSRLADRVGPIEARTVGKMGLTKEMFAAAERQYYGASPGGASASCRPAHGGKERGVGCKVAKALPAVASHVRLLQSILASAAPRRATRRRLSRPLHFISKHGHAGPRRPAPPFLGTWLCTQRGGRRGGDGASSGGRNEREGSSSSAAPRRACILLIDDNAAVVTANDGLEAVDAYVHRCAEPPASPGGASDLDRPRNSWR
eukprot:tig00020713_g13411.t1